jgi:hypothetical protein
VVLGRLAAAFSALRGGIASVLQSKAARRERGRRSLRSLFRLAGFQLGLRTSVKPLPCRSPPTFLGPAARRHLVRRAVHRSAGGIRLPGAGGARRHPGRHRRGRGRGPEGTTGPSRLGCRRLGRRRPGGAGVRGGQRRRCAYHGRVPARSARRGDVAHRHALGRRAAARAGRLGHDGTGRRSGVRGGGAGRQSAGRAHRRLGSRAGRCRVSRPALRRPTRPPTRSSSAVSWRSCVTPAPCNGASSPGSPEPSSPARRCCRRCWAFWSSATTPGRGHSGGDRRLRRRAGRRRRAGPVRRGAAAGLPGPCRN